MKVCCDEKQRNGELSGYLIDVKGRVKILYIKIVCPKWHSKNFLSICLLLGC